MLTDGTQTLELYHLQGTNHADTMLIGYLPKAKVLIEADAYNPAPPNAAPGPVVKENENLYENIKRSTFDNRSLRYTDVRRRPSDRINREISGYYLSRGGGAFAEFRQHGSGVRREPI